MSTAAASATSREGPREAAAAKRPRDGGDEGSAGEASKRVRGGDDADADAAAEEAQARLARLPEPEDWSYRGGKKLLAPMVRIGMMPFRLMAAEYGADMCYSEELIDKKLLQCERVWNENGGGQGVPTVDFCRQRRQNQGKREYPVLRVRPGERVVLQMGTADPVLALRAAELVAGDVRAVDVNMGCPKHFSISGGMGAALLKEPEKVRDIMSTLRRNLNLPVTCKIRLLPDMRRTVELARVIEACGVSAFAVHARRKEDRPRHRPLYGDVRTVKDSVGCPVILNGDCFYHGDFARLAEESGCDSVMTARGAMWNASIFSSNTLPVWDVANRYAELSRQYTHMWKNTKYTLVAMVNKQAGKTPEFNRLNTCRTEEDMYASLPALRAIPAVGALPYRAPAPEYAPRGQ